MSFPCLTQANGRRIVCPTCFLSTGVNSYSSYPSPVNSRGSIMQPGWEVNFGWAGRTPARSSHRQPKQHCDRNVRSNTATTTEPACPCAGLLRPCTTSRAGLLRVLAPPTPCQSASGLSHLFLPVPLVCGFLLYYLIAEAHKHANLTMLPGVVYCHTFFKPKGRREG
jgi:hypothetical protein